MKIPSFLVKNSTIGITAPSFGCTTQPYSSYFKSACRQIEERGYKIKTGKTVFMDDGKGISTDPKTAALELMEFYTSDDTQAIISAGGGEAMCETAAYINFEALKDAKPKWFMGYSDNTNFIFPLATISGIASVYGPCISGFGKKWEQGENDAFRILEGTTKKVKGFPMFQKPKTTFHARKIRHPNAITRQKKRYSTTSTAVTAAKWKECFWEDALTFCQPSAAQN